MIDTLWSKLCLQVTAPLFSLPASTLVNVVVIGIRKQIVEYYV